MGGYQAASPSTVAMAETFPPVVNTHFGFSSWTSVGLIECSAGWLQVLFRFCPAIRHRPDRVSSDGLCALSAETNQRTLINLRAANIVISSTPPACTIAFGLHRLRRTFPNH